VTDRQTQMTPQPKAAKSSYSRAEWMTLLAEAPVVELEAHWRSIPHPKFDWVRRPEYGSAMIRGRASGTGAQFNLGDVTVTRCTLQLETGEIGAAYVIGRDKRHAALAAIFDALALRDQVKQERTIQGLIADLEHSRLARQQAIAAETQTSKVDFTMLSRSEVSL